MAPAPPSSSYHHTGEYNCCTAHTGKYAGLQGQILEYQRAENPCVSSFNKSFSQRGDALTGPPNRLLFDDRLQQQLAQASRQSQMLAVLFIDLDSFKTINDTQGHTVGDQLLRITAERLMGCVRNADTVARLGGDEFIALLANISRRHDAEQVAQKILEALARAFVIDGQEPFVTASIGIALYPAGGIDAEALLHNADSAMYHAKQAGKNNYRLYKTVAPAQP